MGTTFVEIEGRGFWMRGGVLELWLRLLALHIEEPTDEQSPAYRIQRQWLLASRGYFSGCIPVGLADAVATAEGRDVVLRAVDSLVRSLQRAPSKLDKDVLNLLGIESSVFTENFETARLLEVASAWVELISGRIHADASVAQFMPGS